MKIITLKVDMASEVEEEVEGVPTQMEARVSRPGAYSTSFVECETGLGIPHTMLEGQGAGSCLGNQGTRATLEEDRGCLGSGGPPLRKDCILMHRC